jgi:hypothetical protein
MLSADLPGSIESPGYYFRTDTDSADAAVDNLMLTRGWRRFKWEEVLSERTPAFEFLPEIRGHIIRGMISTADKAPAKDIAVYLSAPGTRTQFQSSRSDEGGRIKFEMKDFYNDADIIVQTDNQTDSGYRIDIESPFFASNSQKLLPAIMLSGYKEELLKQYIAAQVQNSFSYDKLSSSYMPLPDSTPFYTNPNKSYLLDNYVRFTTLEEVLREYVAEVAVRQRNGRVHLPVFDEISRTPFNKSPLVLLDGMPVFDLQKLMRYDPLKIRKLDVINREYYLGSNSFSGVVNLITYKGNMEGLDIDPHAVILDYEGLQVKRAFYSPVYETPEQAADRLPDFRNLLYWSPSLKSGPAGHAGAQFYSSDVPGKYAIVLQGIADDGRTGAGIAYFEVKK